MLLEAAGVVAGIWFCDLMPLFGAFFRRSQNGMFDNLGSHAVEGKWLAKLKNIHILEFPFTFTILLCANMNEGGKNWSPKK